VRAVSAQLRRVIGCAREAELVTRYAERIATADQLPEPTAMKLACYAYQTENIYVLAAPGQVWESVSEAAHPRRIEIREVGHSTAQGPVARYQAHPSGVLATIALNSLDTLYRLTDWPTERMSDPRST
jgi:hypothetical protein